MCPVIMPSHVELLLIVYRDYNDFLEDLEEDPSYRQNINIYKGWSFAAYFIYLHIFIDCKYRDV